MNPIPAPLWASPPRRCPAAVSTPRDLSALASRAERRVIRQCLAVAARRLHGCAWLTRAQRRALVARMQRRLHRTSIALGSPFARAALVGSFILLLTSAPARAAGPFIVDASNPFAGITGVHTTAVSFGDIDGDGDLDLIVGDQFGTAGRLRLFKNTGSRTNPVFSTTPDTLPTGLPTPVGSGGSQHLLLPAIGDFNNDGRRDVIVADCPSSASNAITTLAYYKQNSDGSFSTVTAASLGLPTQTGSTAASYGAMRFADLDNDGDDDIVMVSGKGGVVSYFRNDGNGTFTQLTGGSNPLAGVPTLSYPLMAFADVDGDGDLDIFVGIYVSQSTADLQFYRNDAGTFVSVAPATAFPGSEFITFSPKKWLNPQLVDIDGDGDPDLVIGDYDIGATPAPIHFRRNTPPSVASLSPADNATGVSASGTFTLTFSAAASAGTGNLYVKKTSDNSTVATLAATTLTYSGTQASFTPSGLAGSTGYYITWDATAFKRTSDNAVITGNPSTSYWNFTTAAADNTPPTVTSIIRQSPASQATNSTSATFRVTFSEAINTPATTNFAVAPVGSDTVAGTVNSVTSVLGSQNIYDVAVTITSGTGEFRLKVKD